MSFHTAKRIGHVTAKQYAASGDVSAHAPRRGQREYVMSRSSLMDFAKNPRKWLSNVPSEDTDSTDDGTMIDTLVLTPEQFPKLYVCAPSEYEKTMMECPQCKTQTSAKKCAECKCERMPVLVSKEWDRKTDYCKDWEAKHAAEGRTVLKVNEMADAQASLEVIKADDYILELLDVSERQIMFTAFWHDDETGIDIPIKTLVDIAPRTESKFSDVLADFKRTRSAVVSGWPYEVERWSLDVQAAMYLDVFNAATGENRKEFRHVLSENHAPFAVGRRWLSSEFLDIGRGKYQQALAKYARCLTENRWPGYDDGGTEGAIVPGWTCTQPTQKMREEAILI